MTKMTNDLVFYVRLSIKPDCIERWRRSIAELVERMRREDTFVSCHLQQAIDAPNEFTLFEIWREPSVDAFVRNQIDAKDYRLAYERELPDMLETPRTASALRSVAAWFR